VLLLLLAFALCAAYRAKLKAEATPENLVRRACRQFAGWGVFLPSLLIVWFALKYGSEDLINAKVDDMPIMETVLGLLGIFGVYLAARSIKPRAYINVWTCVFALFFTVLVYGGYAWTEVNYDQQVHQAYAAGSGASWTPSGSEKPALQAQVATNWPAQSHK
jgi:cytochrome bd-type quinol oxidase subunit 2